MCRLRDARDDEIDAIYSESYALWGGGLSPSDYRGLWEDLRRTAWARRNASFRVLVDDADAVVSSTKIYRPELRLLGRSGRATVIGALFTPAAYRGRGHGRRVVEAVLDEARRDGSRAVLLFSDIGPRFYTSYGFRALPSYEQWTALAKVRSSIPPGWSLRPTRVEEADDLLRAHDAACRSRPISVARDADHWEFLRVRSRRFFERLGDPSIRLVCESAHHRGQFAGYLVAVWGQGEWSVREVGARTGDPAVMAIILRLAAERARQAGLREFYGWLPEEVCREIGDWKLRSRRRRRAVPMLLALDPTDDLDRLDSASAAYLPFQDQF